MLSIFSQFIFGSSKAGPARSSRSIRGTTEKTQNEANQADTRSSGSSGGNVIKPSWWKDKSLCFDLRAHDLEPNRSEQLIGCFFPIEDVKGNPDELGLLEVTNLRLVWICPSKKRVNLSIGWRTVSLVYEQNLKDALGEPQTSLFVLTKYESTKYEFVFNKPAQMIYTDHRAAPEQSNWLSQSIQPLMELKQKTGLQVSHLSPPYFDDPFDVVFKVWQSYKQTHLFRHCRTNVPHLLLGSRNDDLELNEHDPLLVSKLLRIEEINLLPSEQIIESYSNIVHSESRSTKHLGTLVLTNIRIIWVDSITSFRNLSIPYIRINSIKIKQNEKLLVSTHDYLGSLRQADFRIQKSSTLTVREPTNCRRIYEQATKLWCSSKVEPKFGPESCEDSIQCASHLQRIEHLLAQHDAGISSFGTGLDARDSNLRSGMPPQRYDEETVIVDQSKLINSNDDQDEQGSDDGLDGYKDKLNSYIGEQLIEGNIKLIYSKELGLAVEQPKDRELDLRRIWIIDV